ncbi:hypothetical protein ACS0TY_022600 [Phlomoides rotata]
MLGNSLGSLETSWVMCDTLYSACHVAIKASFEKSLNVAQHKFSSNVYNYLRSVVSVVALEKLFDEIKLVKRPEFDSSECNHILRKVYGLPCAHEVEEYVYADKPVPIYALNPFWRKLDLEPTVKDDHVKDFDNCFDDALGDMAKVYQNYSPEERLIFLKKMRELANPGTTNLVELKPKVSTRGRPKKGKKRPEASTKRDPSLFEIKESQVGTCSMPKEFTVYDVDESFSTPLFQKNGVPMKQPVFLYTYIILCT